MPARLLLVDDEEINLEILSNVLEDEYEIDKATNAAEAMTIVNTRAPDLVLLDVHMPDVDGYQLIGQIREADERIPVIFVTASSDTTSEAKGLELGAVDYITKPYNPAIIKLRVRNQLIMKDISNNLLELIVNTTPDLLAFKDMNGVYRMANESFCTLVGVPSDKLYGMTDEQIFPAEKAQQYRKEDSEVLAAGEMHSYEEWVESISDHRKVYLAKQKSPVYSHQMRLLGVLYVGCDITARVIAEQEKEKLHEQLAQSQKIEAIGRLTGGIAHDFNNMMVGITTYAELGLRALPPTDKIHKYFQNIIDTAHKLTGLNRQLLDFSRKGSILPKRLNLNQEVEKALNLFKMMVKRNITLQFRPGENVPDVFIDPVQLDQLIANFLSNAVDAIGADNAGTITLSTQAVNSTSMRQSRDLRPGNYAVFVIRDSGCGISQENLQKIFEPFFTTKEVGKGTGLGLPSIYGIVQQNHGHMTVQSTVGVGTQFSCYFPECKETADATAPVEGETLGTVLLVHSQGEILTPAMEALTKQKYRVLAANTAERATQIAQEHQGKIDLLVLDITLPEVNAIEFTERLHRGREAMKTLLVSGFIEQIEEIKKDLPYEVVRIKPFVEADFVAAIQKVMEKQ